MDLSRTKSKTPCEDAAEKSEVIVHSETSPAPTWTEKKNSKSNIKKKIQITVFKRTQGHKC